MLLGGGTGGGTSVTLTLSTSDETPTSILVTRSEPTSGTLQTWSLEYKRWNDADWTLFANNLTALTQTVPDLVAYDPETDPDPLVTPLYTFRAVGVVTIETPAATATGSTTEAPPVTGWTLQRSTTIAAQLGNGMLAAVDTVPLAGAIPAQGRTIGSKLKPLGFPLDYAVKVYGVRFRLGNLRQVAISGGKMIGGFTTFQGAGPNNVIGTDPLTGYVQLTIGGDPLLPIPAAPVGGLMTRWTDILRFPGGIAWRGGTYAYRSFDWRFFQPQMVEATDYAVTYSSWGTQGFQKISTLQGYESGIQQGSLGAIRFDIAYSDGDIVTDPAAIGVWGSSPPASPPWYFGPPGPEASPILEAEWFTEEVPA